MDFFLSFLWLGSGIVDFAAWCAEKPSNLVLVVLNLFTFVVVAFVAAVIVVMIEQGPPPRELGGWISVCLPIGVGLGALLPLNWLLLRWLR